ncbi:glycosyl transferase [Curtobacterium flaccumfaciens pv. poinsettiae]|nr:glycosyl transferase [Curtobacterium flaccumfaciens pv. poinsettiae]
MALAGVALGFAFLTKMLQGLLVLPAFGLVYLFAARTGWGRRVIGLVVAAGSLVVAAGWWVVAVWLWPAESRPYIGGSTNNTVLDLVFGYNGLGRIFGGSGNGGGGGGMTGGTAGGSFGGSTGLNRLFSSEMGLEISWLLPAALIALVVGLVVIGRRHLADPARAGLVLWGGWLLVTGLVFSYMSGTIHPYYTVALAPAIAGLVGTGGALLWHARARFLGRLGLAAMIGVTAFWGWCLLNENPTWLPWLRWVMLAGGLLSAALIVIGSVPSLRRLVTVGVLAGTLFGLSGTTAYALATTTVAHSGSIPSVGPAGSSSGGTGGGGTGGMPGGTDGPGGPASGSDHGGSDSTSDSQQGPGGTPPEGASGEAPEGATGQAPGGTTEGSDGAGSEAGSGTGLQAGGGGTGGGTSTSSALRKLLEASDAKWAAAVNGSQSAAQLELDTDTAVMAIGGWSSDPAPTLAQFKAAVADGDIGYYVSSGSRGGMGGGSSTASAIQEWVAANYGSTTVGGQTVYDLSSTE